MFSASKMFEVLSESPAQIHLAEKSISTLPTSIYISIASMYFVLDTEKHLENVHLTCPANVIFCCTLL